MLEVILTRLGAEAGQLAIVLFPLIMLAAGAQDVLARRIPNMIPAAAALLFLPFAVLTGLPLWTIGTHVLIASAFLIAGYILFLLRIIGGGDAKLVAVAALWLGYPCSLLFLGSSILAGGILAALIGIWFFISVEGSVHSSRFGKHFGSLAPSVPYGFAIAAGAILATPFSWWMWVAMS